MKIGRIIFAVIILAVIVIVGIAATSSVLIIAEDESEGGIPGVDMGATWNLTGGFNWIYREVHLTHSIKHYTTFI